MPQNNSGPAPTGQQPATRATVYRSVCQQADCVAPCHSPTQSSPADSCRRTVPQKDSATSIRRQQLSPEAGSSGYPIQKTDQLTRLAEDCSFLCLMGAGGLGTLGGVGLVGLDVDLLSERESDR